MLPAWIFVCLVVVAIIIHLLRRPPRYEAMPPLPPPVVLPVTRYAVSDEHLAELAARIAAVESTDADDAPPVVVPLDGETVDAFHERRIAAGVNMPRGQMPGHHIWSTEHEQFHDPTYEWSAEHEQYHPPGYVWAAWYLRPTFVAPQVLHMSPFAGGPPCGSHDCPVCHGVLSGALNMDSNNIEAIGAPCNRCYALS